MPVERLNTPPIFVDTAEVADLLGLPSAAAFLTRRVELEDSAGFPMSLPHWKRPLKYRRDQVLAWLERQGRPKSDEDLPIDPALLAAGKVLLFAEARRP